MTVTHTTADLVGVWHLEEADPSLDMDEPVELQFEAGGELRYCIDARSRWQVMRLTYRIDGDTLVTDQPSHPREERTRFDLLGQTLVLHYGGGKARFTRGSRRCPVV
jgi:hypothetical protein